MINSTTGDSNSPATFSDIIGTGYFPPQLIPGNVNGGEVSSSTAGDLNLPENRPSTFKELIGTGYFRRRLFTGNVDTAGDSNPPEPAMPSTFSEANESETVSFQQQSSTSNVETSEGGKTKETILILPCARNRMNVFPPLLTSLNRNGRPRFSLEKVRDGERLVITKEPNDRPEVVRSPTGNGRVKMMLVEGGDDYDGDDDRTDDEELNSNGKSVGNGMNDQIE